MLVYFQNLILQSLLLTNNIEYKFLSMTGIEPRTSAVESNHSSNWATPTAHI